MKKNTVTKAHVNDSKKTFSDLILIKNEHHLQILINCQWDHCTVEVRSIKLQAYFLNSMINIKLSVLNCCSVSFAK